VSEPYRQTNSIGARPTGGFVKVEGWPDRSSRRFFYRSVPSDQLDRTVEAAFDAGMDLVDVELHVPDIRPRDGDYFWARYRRIESQTEGEAAR
jgi:hypothetical protein